MFTGIVVALGAVKANSRAPTGDGSRLDVTAPAKVMARLKLGSSISVSGVCLTVVGVEPGAFSADLSPETLRRTTLGTVEAGSLVNLEPALRLGDELGGHWVQGHVDATVELLESKPAGEYREDVFSLPAVLRLYLAKKGSITLDGVSLTVSELQEDRFSVSLIPETLTVTTLGKLRPGNSVNCEVDALAKYVERLLLGRGLLAR